MAVISGLIRKTAAFFRQRRGKWLFLVVNGALLLLYGWTLTESVPITVEVTDGNCLAILPDRTAEIPCPGLSQGEIGLSLERTEMRDLAKTGPLDWFAPRAGWRRILVSGDDDTRPIQVTFTDQLPYWRRVGDEWRPLLEHAALRWRAPIQRSFKVEASVRRPEGELAGVLLLEPGGQAGWVFQVDTNERQASWWRWEGNQPTEFLLGIPFQKSLISQIKSLLRVILRGHHGALLVLLVGWLLNKLLRGRLLPSFKKIRPQYGVWLVAFVMLGAAVFITIDALEQIPHVQDSVTFLFQAELLAKGRLFAPAPQLPEFFKQEFLTVQNGRWFGQYPPGFALVLALGVLMKLPWLVNPLLSAVTVVLLYKLGALLFSRKVGLLAAVLALFSPYYLLMSGSFMVHPAELFWTVLFLLGWCYWLKGGRSLWWLVGAGMALGMVLLTRQVTAVAVGGSVVGGGGYVPHCGPNGQIWP
ncbi:MAG: glycosyltransferase family 39 protein [Candidatus Promineifilaceae bacterium]